MFTYKIGISTSEHDRFVIDSPQTNLLQSSSWAKIKDSWGNDRLGFYQDDKLVAVASVLIQPLPLGFSMIYIPRGPITVSYTHLDVYKRQSLTPSPVIATTLPSFCQALTIRTLCSGDTRA